MWIDDLVQHLRDQNIEGLGASAFVRTIPDTIRPGAMITEGYRGIPVDEEMPGYFRGSIQVIVRAAKSQEAEEIANAVKDVLTIHDRTIGDTYINRLIPLHLPVPYPRSNGDFYEASTNFDICFSA